MKPFEEVKKEYDAALAIFHEESRAALNEPTLNQYMEAHAIAYKKFEPYKLEHDKCRYVTFQPIPEYCDHMPIEEFIEACKDGSFIDYDGSGNYATATGETDLNINPSDVTNDTYIKDVYTHVCWYNK